jgi:hypothetical protein
LIERPHALSTTDERGFEIWQKLVVYSSEAAKHGGHPIHTALIRRLRQAGIAWATALRGAAAFEIVDELTAERGWSRVRWSPRWPPSTGTNGTEDSTSSIIASECAGKDRHRTAQSQVERFFNL